MLTTLSLGLGWGLSDPCEANDPNSGGQSRALPQVEAIDDYVINPKIVQPGQQVDF